MPTPEEVISDFFEITERRAGRCVQALDAAGYVIVPKEATQEIINAGLQIHGSIRPLWRALLAAAPNTKKAGHPKG